MSKSKNKYEDILVKIVAGLMLLGFFAALWGLGLLVDYIKYKSYIGITHSHLSFWQYHVLKSHLRIGQ